MREILFRGKQVGNGEWMYGVPVPITINSYSTGRIELVRSHSYDGLDYFHLLSDSEEIMPETLGQYTGLQDKNGKKIFEGDIVEYQFDDDYPIYIGVVSFGNHLIKDDISSFGWFVRIMDENYYSSISLRENDCLRIIGNIHDNPEFWEENQ